METWFVIIISLCISALLRSISTTLLCRSSGTKQLPPGPLSIPFIGNLIWLRKPISELESVLVRQKTNYGPLITMRIGPRRFIYVGSHSLTHQALIQNGAVFSDRPAPPPTLRILNRTPFTITSSVYGPTWRLLRRNLTHEILNAAHVKSHASSRSWILSELIHRLLDTKDHFVTLIDHFQCAMFSLLVFMCFGNKLAEEKVKEIESMQRRVLLGFNRSNSLNYWPPRLSKILFPIRWEKLNQLRLDQDNLFIPLIRARLAVKELISQQEFVATYVDSLVDLRLPDENNRKLEEWEIVSMCSEFLSAGTDTTSTALQWIMANLVRNSHIQDKLYQEIIGIMGPPPLPSKYGNAHQRQQLPLVVEEENIGKMPYLKAVVLEGLRRHPPGHFVLPHKVTRDTELDGYLIPRDAIVNFMVAEMAWDSKVWVDPMEFKPERFLDDVAFDVTGSKEIKMMPFGAGRRICPASTLALLHLEYFVANLIWYFEWTPCPGDEIDLSEKQEFTTVMNNPLCARISPRGY